MSTLNVDKVDPSTGTALEIGTSGDTITVPSGATFNVAGTLQSGGSTLVPGKVLQVVRTDLAATATTTSTSYATVLTSSTITLASSSNYLLCLVSYNIEGKGNSTTSTLNSQLQLQKEDGTALASNTFYYGEVINATSGRVSCAGCLIGYYTPGSTSEAPRVQYKITTGGGLLEFKGTDAITSPGSVSSITVLEIAA